MQTIRIRVIVAILTFGASGCSPTVDLTRNLTVQGVSTGWTHAGFVDGKSKLVPTVSFRLNNLSDRTLAMLQVNALFRRTGDEDEWGSGFLTAAGSDGLAGGARTGTFTIRSQLGYTGTDSPAAMLENSHFVDATVDLFAKYGSAQWTKVGEYAIARRLMEP
jgi:hypothetical protein